MERKPYQIQYTDNSYRIIELDKSEFDAIALALSFEKHYVHLEEALLVLHDVRAIVKLQEDEEIEAEEEAYNDSEYGFVDHETAKWLKENGVDLVNGGMKHDDSNR